MAFVVSLCEPPPPRTHRKTCTEKPKEGDEIAGARCAQQAALLLLRGAFERLRQSCRRSGVTNGDDLGLKESFFIRPGGLA